MPSAPRLKDMPRRQAVYRFEWWVKIKDKGTWTSSLWSLVPPPGKLLPSARHERRVGAFLVRAAWERRPEGPAYLLSSVMLLYLAGQCAYFSTHFPPPSDHWHSEDFPEFLRTDSFCSS